MRRAWQILVWTILPAAFIGPGTVTTCSQVGARFGTTLAWTLLFSVFATIILQEMAARLTLATGDDLATFMRRDRTRPTANLIARGLVAPAIVFGCMAFQAGNIIGAAEGAHLATGVDRRIAAVALALAAAAFLFTGGARMLGRVLGVIVALMGIAFLRCAAASPRADARVLVDAVVPSWPEGSTKYVLALIGTTVVPYNLFLGSGLARGQAAGNVRVGIALSVAVGGAISLAILLTGTFLEGGEFGYDRLAAAMTPTLGEWAPAFFGAGLFTAGFSSAITAPWAAGLVVSGAYGVGGAGDQSKRRSTMAVVLAGGLAFSLAGRAPAAAIILAQALNGIVLPLAAAYVVVQTSRRAVMGERANSRLLVAAGVLVVAIATVLGANGVILASKALMQRLM